MRAAIKVAVMTEGELRAIVREVVCDVLGALEARQQRRDEAVASMRRDRFREWAQAVGLIGWRRWLPRFMR